jgi:cyclic beta-1,2-glucan synthetase
MFTPWKQVGRWFQIRRRDGPTPGSAATASDTPLRAQLFSAQQMVVHGRSLARSHRVSEGPGTERLIGRLRENEDILEQCGLVLTAMVRDQLRITPAGEWLLDNYYLIEEQIRTARRHLPPRYSRQLPVLEQGGPAGSPRVYHLALEAVAHGDGRVDADTMRRFVAAYQTVSPLKLGELWAIPIMLRLAVIENLRRMAVQVMRDGTDRRLADEWGRRLTATAASTPKDLVLMVAELARSSPPATGPFVSTLTRGLQGRSVAMAMVMTWLEHWLADSGNSIEHLIQAESQQQAADQVSISNSIGSLRFLSGMDWRDFVESMSMVDHTLREDPGGVYARMDFATRDHYRHVVERLARLTRVKEVDVARAAVQLAEAHAQRQQAQAHVGYYLVDDGISATCSRLADIGGQRPVRLRRQLVPLPAYLMPIALLATVFTVGLLTAAHPPVESGWLLSLLAVLGAVVFSELAIALVNWGATVLIGPRPLPRLDFSDGIPVDCRTLVVVPSMFGSLAAIDGLVEALEVRYLANRDKHLHFALLTDFLDAEQQAVPGDDDLLAHAGQCIRDLNARHAQDDEDRFFLLHRPRLWNASEGVWMGSERKRGKLAALNRLLLSGAHDAFMAVVGNTDVLSGVRYVITLDADTRLPRDAARELVGTLAHPLNRAQFDAARRCVVRGYGILQPGVGSSMGAGRGSRYALLLGTEPGIDPYTRTVSDVYQDLFGEGSFVGKGIYDVKAFEGALDNRFLDNRILSHDLLEGCHARAGLVSDVRLYEEYPARYASDVSRRYRWIRGDWQLLPWLLPWIRRLDGSRERNPLSMLSRGKLVDNLRRSLVPAATTVLLVLGWVLFSQPLAWTLWLLLLWLLPALMPAIRDLVAKPPDLTVAIHLRQVAQAGWRQLRRVTVAVACLPFEAWYSLGAIARTLWRVLVSRRHLLQWNPSSEVERQLKPGMWAEFRRMWVAPVFALACGLLLWRVNAQALWVAAPILALWLLSPALMAWLSAPVREQRAPLSPAQRAFLGRLARRTWAYFESHVTEEHHWLPPDNVQDHPTQVVAARTSPTNIGLALLANLGARDLGYLSVAGLITRTRLTLATLETLPRHRGHFFNWYDTRTLRTLPPRYVSTVDSGNLAGFLLTLRQGLLALIDEPLLPSHVFRGLADTLGVLQEHLREHARRDRGLERALAAFAERLTASGAVPVTLPEATRSLVELRKQARTIAEVAANLGVLPEPGVPHWPEVLVDACEAQCRELELFAPTHALRRVPSLRELQDPRFGDAISRHARDRVHELEYLAWRVDRLSSMENDFLYDRRRHLFAIGYNLDENQLDAGYYDLLASEARLGTFIAIARGQLPQESWFALGRLLTEVDGEATLLSWSGSMFEYLMPQLVMPSYPGTLLDQTSRHAVAAHIRYGARRGVPWGNSESGYNMVDAAKNYQYQAFGVPGLGLKRGLAQDLVVAPYASMMALMVTPVAACQNLQRLDALGFGGTFGLYEAIDFTPRRLPRGDRHALVRSFMAHHQGMGLLAMVHLLCDQSMQKRFVSDPEIAATLLLLQERIPRTGVFHPHHAEHATMQLAPRTHEVHLRVLRDPDTPRPAIQLLSNGRYHTMLSSAGGGYARLGDLAITRWREDATRDHWGSFCYLRDVASGEFWSAAHQPTCVPVDNYEAIFSDAKAEFRGRKSGYDYHLEIAISAEDDIELRRLHLRNRERKPRTIEVTTYAEVVLASAIGDELHPAFNNLFMQTRIVREKQALLCTRRARSSEESPLWMFHLVAVHDADIREISYETDRARFLGRGNTPRNPEALKREESLSDTDGSVLDPIVAIRCRITLQPQQTAVIDLVTGVGADSKACEALIDKYRDRRLANRVFELAWTHAQVVRRQINASQADAQLYERMAGLMVYAHPMLRARASILQQNRRGQAGLWSQAISGDLPIVLVRIASADNIELVRQLVQAHSYWRLKGLDTDLVIWNEDRAVYRQQLQEEILGLVSAGPEPNVLDRPGGIFVRSAHQIQEEDRILLQAVARVIVSDRSGTLAAQLLEHIPAGAGIPPMLPPGERLPAPADAWPLPSAPGADRVLFDNGLGAFSADAREYVITQSEGVSTPAPWCNVLANAVFGTVVSESTTGYTWFENAHEFRLTPWHNDPVSDSGGEAFYLRDEDSGRFWSPTPLPCRGRGAYRIRHGFGYTVYEHCEDGLASELWVFVGRHDPVKYVLLKLHNRSGRPRRFSVTGYVEWVLGDIRSRSQMHVISDMDAASGVLTARNRYSTEFKGRVAFFDVDATTRTFTSDRAEFVGRNGSLGDPAALRRQHLSGRQGIGIDPCAAIQVPIHLGDDQTSETVFTLGVGRSRDEALWLAAGCRGLQHAVDALAEVRAHWVDVLGSVQVETPDAAFDALANGWLLYQTLGCRYLARSGFYQSGGAFGFRDQLQDTMATVHADPGLSRRHLLLSAAKQFPQGDVLHWWHPTSGRGVRTRCSDDYLWLPMAACHYLQVTGDYAVLDADVGFIEGRPVNADEESYYDQPALSDRVETLYEHCVLALKRGMSLLGARGLPLIGTGDWNDGMNRVGAGGSGESVWLGFFLYDALRRFSSVASARGDDAFAEHCDVAAQRLRENLEAHGWDGDWYRRAWFDDGTPLGSSQSEECRIDSISQSWSVLSGAGDPLRARRAMDALDRHLVKRDAGIVQLLEPPFDQGSHDPGYIRGYVPGVRENGGQYTHAAVWAAMAFARQGDAERAWELARMINPINHALDQEAMMRYRVEPYVLAADVYAVDPHGGRGGWTWYTGSAGWMYRLMLESLLGLQRHGDSVQVRPCIPAEWPGYRIDYRHGGSRYRIRVAHCSGGSRALCVDGRRQADLSFPLVDDGRDHQVDVDWPRPTVRPQ